MPVDENAKAVSELERMQQEYLRLQGANNGAESELRARGIDVVIPEERDRSLRGTNASGNATDAMAALVVSAKWKRKVAAKKAARTGSLRRGREGVLLQRLKTPPSVPIRASAGSWHAELGNFRPDSQE